MVKFNLTESRGAQIEREIENLVSQFVESPNKKTSDSLFYLSRERAGLIRKAKRRSSALHKKAAESSVRTTTILSMNSDALTGLAHT